MQDNLQQEQSLVESEVKETLEEVTEEVEETPEFTDNEENDTKDEDSLEKSNNQKGSKSSYYAQLRREKEAKEKSANVEKTHNTDLQNSYLKGVIKGSGGKNPYTNKEIKDEFDLQEFELMTKLAQEGKDPINDYLDALKQRERETRLEQSKIEEKKQNKFKELDDFSAKYGVNKLSELLQDDNFLKFCDNFKDDVEITRVYELYQGINKDIDKRAEELAKDKYARILSSTGGTNKGATAHKSFRNMSKEEFRQYQEKVLNGEI